MAVEESLGAFQGGVQGASSLAKTGNPYLMAGGAVIGGISGAMSAYERKKASRERKRALRKAERRQSLIDKRNHYYRNQELAARRRGEEYNRNMARSTAKINSVQDMMNRIMAASQNNTMLRDKFIERGY